MISINDLSTIPNLLSILRVLLIPFAVYYISQENGRLLAVAFIVATMGTDYFDGFFARKFDQISDLGKIIDPVADKIAVIAVVFALVLYREFPIWAFVLILARDIIIVVFGMYVIKRREYVPSSNMTGKVAVTLIAIVGLVYTLNLDSIKVYILYLSIVFLFLSLIGYYWSVLKSPVKVEK